ncbi:hypothetical protein [Amycolatopsis sp. CB00013]|uniref:hypothetical protein n=1 Tax=Amycolatopsis sp. CB00013 TaxID=1703945 RepID=UPI00095FE4CE|nr:hypothetical protein [Amycolatopsis sp. CB00013]OKJ97414.1 hypothetical protein AMK34_10445 [Amycolatopsis sp. CB00013]
MTDPKGVKTLGLKVGAELHAQFTLIAQLDGISLNDATLRAVELYVETKRSEPDFAQRATAALEAIQREAEARAGAIQGLFGTDPAEVAETKPPATRGRKAAE